MDQQLFGRGVTPSTPETKLISRHITTSTTPISYLIAPENDSTSLL
jgi:hypothetical protein